MPLCVCRFVEKSSPSEHMQLTAEDLLRAQEQ